MPMPMPMPMPTAVAILINSDQRKNNILKVLKMIKVWKWTINDTILHSIADIVIKMSMLVPAWDTLQ